MFRENTYITYSSFICSINITRVDPVSENFQPSSTYRFIDHDLFSQGNILLIDGSSVVSTDRSSGDTDLIAGSAENDGYVEGTAVDIRFNNPLSILQLNTTDILVVDQNNHCIRIISRVTKTSFPFAGQCLIDGDDDGPFLNSKLTYPGNIVMEPNLDSAMFTHNRQYIKQLNFTSRTILTYAQLNHTIYDLTFHPENGTLYISIPSGLGYVIGGNLQLLNQNDGFRDGLLESASFKSFLPSIIFLTKKLLLISDYDNGVYRLLDFTYNTTSTICEANQVVSAGSVDYCKTYRPLSALLLARERKVLIVSESSVGTISYKNIGKAQYDERWFIL